MNPIERAETLIAAFAARFAETPERPFLEWKGAEVSYGEMGRRVESLAAGLAGLGVAKGDRVGVFMPNGPDLVVAHLAAGRVGAVRVPLNPAYRSGEAAHVLADAGARVLFAGPGQAELARRVRGDLPFLEWIVHPGAEGRGEASWSAVEKTGGSAPEPRIAPDDPAMICYTSGTTGRAKGAVLTHKNLLSNIRTLARLWEWTGRDILCLALPLFHLHGLGLALHGTLITGCRAILLERFDAAEVLKFLASRSCTMFMGVPTMYERLLALPNVGARRGLLRRMRLFISGSAPLPASTFRRFYEETGHEILERYGLSETMMNTSNPYRGARKPGSVGPPLPGVELYIAGPRGNPPPTGEVREVGEVGEVCVRGPNVFRGYLNRPDADAEAFRDGWFRTGDLGRLDEEGYLYLEGRAGDLIITGGCNVYPAEVEEALRSHPAVAEAAVVGAPDPEYGEAVLAVVVRKGEVSAEEIVAHCRERLAPYKKPRRVEFTEKLPMNAMGKVRKDILRERYGRGENKGGR